MHRPDSCPRHPQEAWRRTVLGSSTGTWTSLTSSPTGKVFWPTVPTDQLSLKYSYVRCKVEKNHDPEPDNREWDAFIVAKDRGRGSAFRVEPIRAIVLPEEDISGPEMIISSSSEQNLNTTVYRSRMRQTILDGPWRVAKCDESNLSCLRPKNDGYVTEFRRDRLPDGTVFPWTDRHNKTHIVLLSEPSPEDGETIDQLSRSELANWLVKQLKRDFDLLNGMNNAVPGWQKKLKESVETLADPIQRVLNSRRWEKLQLILEFLDEQESRLADLLELPRFKEKVNQAIIDAVKKRQDEIESDAKEADKELPDTTK